MSSIDFPVIVIGGGPVGLTQALELDHHEIACAVIEPRRFVEHSRPRAKSTSARTMEHFRRLGVADRIREAAPLKPKWSSRVTFVNTLVGPEITHVDGALGLATSPHVSPEVGQQISQGLVEDVLRDAVAERPGITAYWGYTAVEVRQDDDGVTVVVENDEDGTYRELRAEWVIGADGPRSVVREAMGSRYEGTAGGRPNVNVTFRSQQLASLLQHPQSIHYWSVNDTFPGVVGPLDHDGTWWAISTGTESIESDEHAIAIVRGLVGAEIDVDVIATDPWQARMLLTNVYRNGRLFVVGDAAHQNPPWGGHGFNTGVGDAVNLGWKLAGVISGWAPECLLDSYGTERRPVAAQTIEIAAKNMSTLSVDLAEAGLRDVEAAEAIRVAKSPEFHSEGLIFGYGYGSDAAAQAPDQGTYYPIAAAGNRLPHRVVDAVPIFDHLGRGFTILGNGQDADDLTRAAQARGIPVSSLEAEGATVLIRPDQHIAWIGDAVADPGAILDAALQGFR